MASKIDKSEPVSEVVPLHQQQVHKNNNCGGPEHYCDVPVSRRQKEIAATRSLLSKAPDLISEVEESQLYHASSAQREYPVFEASEIVRGPVLGVGGFGVVYEIKDFNLQIPRDIELLVHSEDANICTEETTSLILLDQEVTTPHGVDERHHSIHHGDSASQVTSSTSTTGQEVTSGNAIGATGAATSTSYLNSTVLNNTSINSNPNGSARQHNTTTSSRTASSSQMSRRSYHQIGCTDVILKKLSATDDSHYDIREARTVLSKQVRRGKTARYAIKLLHRDLNDLERTRGMIDMALEVKYLSVLWHPNISTFDIVFLTE